jgi:hypothetical protein
MPTNTSAATMIKMMVLVAMSPLECDEAWSGVLVGTSRGHPQCRRAGASLAGD